MVFHQIEVPRERLMQDSHHTDSSNTTEGSLADSDLEEASPVPQYEMTQNIKTVRDLWREYTIGLDDATVPFKRKHPAVRDLRLNFGAKWRRKENDRRFLIAKSLRSQSIEGLRPGPQLKYWFIHKIVVL